MPWFNDNLVDRAESFFRTQAGSGDAALKQAAEEQLRTIQKIAPCPLELSEDFKRKQFGLGSWSRA